MHPQFPVIQLHALPHDNQETEISPDSTWHSGWYKSKQMYWLLHQQFMPACFAQADLTHIYVLVRASSSSS